MHVCVSVGFPWWLSGKYPPANVEDARDMGSILGSGRSPGVGNGNPLQYSCLGNPMERRSWWATVHGVTKSQTHKHMCLYIKFFLPRLYSNLPCQGHGYTIPPLSHLLKFPKTPHLFVH